MLQRAAINKAYKILIKHIFEKQSNLEPLRLNPMPRLLTECEAADSAIATSYPNLNGHIYPNT